MDFPPKKVGFEHSPRREDRVWGGKTWLPYMPSFSFLLTSVTTSCGWLSLSVPLSCPRLGDRVLLLHPVTVLGPGLSEPALGELDALGLPPAVLQDAWWDGAGFALETVCQFILDFCKWG